MESDKKILDVTCGAKTIWFNSSITKAFILAMVNTRSATPTIDAVQVVRCKDCAFGNDFDIDIQPYVGYQCEKGYGSHTGDWYCGDGKPIDTE